MVTTIRESDLQRVAESVRPDAKNRVHLPKVLLAKGVTYHIYSTSTGQIVLDPQITIPASEAWIFEDKHALSLVDRGMAESANGQVIDRGSFAKYTKDAP
ncbi:MAG: hypothetical protein A2Z76_03990 [Chloroflexi bacterium RBG_13_56_8b]|nr:MAG: hypothetical protein A2Z76_03990 [Chloroflexi bacterium RBG_13_56_8b]